MHMSVTHPARLLTRSVSDNGGNQCSLSGLGPWWHAARLVWSLFILGWSISTGSMFGQSPSLKIEIIRTGWKRRKSENVSECAYSRSSIPHPILRQSRHPSRCSVLFCGDRGEEEGGEGCVWSGLGLLVKWGEDSISDVYLWARLPVREATKTKNN